MIQFFNDFEQVANTVGPMYHVCHPGKFERVQSCTILALEILWNNLPKGSLKRYADAFIDNSLLSTFEFTRSLAMSTLSIDNVLQVH